MPRLIARLLLGLFPPDYRAQFGAEHLQVLDEVLADATAQGGAALARLCLLELAGLPGAVLRAHWREGKQKMLNARSISLDEKPAGWPAALSGGLPHLLYALALCLTPILAYVPFLRLDLFAALWAAVLKRIPPAMWALHALARPSYWSDTRIFYQSVQWGFDLLIVAGILFAWRRGWPVWSATWLGYGILALFDVLITAFPDGRVAYPMGALWLALTLGVYISQARRSPLGGLLVVLPFSHMFAWYLASDGIAGTLPESFGLIAAGLVLMLAVTAALRSGRLLHALGLALAVSLVVGLGFAYGQVYHSNAFTPPTPTPGRVALQTFAGLVPLALFGLPLWGVLLWRRFHRRPAR